ncbi:ead/Ea22-like family protein [Klebsiella pneumoniae]|uniref:ead/Ea22-like family protein n=1 Tax=Klebsiella pneumoniae TaxID=573 RepID=UPI000DE767D4|nr:ead/Ea22-like family protein [Klebsiella pneumoniae]MBK2493761.1 ead/Ea22-like family protein [Klebsiella pneumoniae]SSK47432.1 Ead domain protein [Klebsiella pneumoniae]
MTDITELAQSLKAAAEKATPGRWERGDGKHGGELLVYCDDALGSAVCEATSEYNAITKYQRIDNLDFIAMANPANVLALVDALEKANRYIERLREWNAGLAQESCERQQLISELEPIRAAAEKLVRCKGRYHSEQNYRALAALFGVKTPDLPPLEHENVHYADAAEMEIAALRQRIAELESRTVKLPDLRQIVSGDRYVWSDGVYNYSQDVKVALAAAGIKVEAE